MRYMGTNMNPSFTLNWCEGSRGQSTYVLKWSKNNAVDLRGVQEWKLFLDSFSVGSAERWRPAMASADRGNTDTHRCFAADNGRGADLVYLDWSRSSPFLNGCYQLLELLSCCHVLQTGWRPSLSKLLEAEAVFQCSKKKTKKNHVPHDQVVIPPGVGGDKRQNLHWSFVWN